MKCQHDPPGRVRANRNQTKNEVLPMGQQTHLDPPGVIFPVSGYTIGIDILESWHNPYIMSLDHGVRAILVEKAKWKTMTFSLS